MPLLAPVVPKPLPGEVDQHAHAGRQGLDFNKSGWGREVGEWLENKKKKEISTLCHFYNLYKKFPFEAHTFIFQIGSFVAKKYSLKCH